MDTKPSISISQPHPLITVNGLKI